MAFVLSVFVTVRFHVTSSNAGANQTKIQNKERFPRVVSVFFFSSPSLFLFRFSLRITLAQNWRADTTLAEKHIYTTESPTLVRNPPDQSITTLQSHKFTYYCNKSNKHNIMTNTSSVILLLLMVQGSYITAFVVPVGPAAQAQQLSSSSSSPSSFRRPDPFHLRPQLGTNSNNNQVLLSMKDEDLRTNPSPFPSFIDDGSFLPLVGGGIHSWVLCVWLIMTGVYVSLDCCMMFY